MLRLDRIGFRALGTSCSVAATAAPVDTASARAALVAARVEVHACERVLSRFDPGSDLSRLNLGHGEWVEVDRRLVAALEAAVRLREETDGRFDPTVLPALEAAGYDRSFELLEPGRTRNADPRPCAGRIDLDARGSRARIEQGAGVDLGAVGKGFIAAQALLALRAAWGGLPGAIVDLGGDVAVWGETPEGGPWRIAVEDPERPALILGTIRLAAGGVCTSGPTRRRFGPDLGLHHLIDPGTGLQAEGGPSAVTVVAPDPVDADAHATALAVTKLADAARYLADRPWLGAILVGGRPEPTVSGDLDFRTRTLGVTA